MHDKWTLLFYTVSFFLIIFYVCGQSLIRCIQLFHCNCSDLLSIRVHNLCKNQLLSNTKGEAERFPYICLILGMYNICVCTCIHTFMCSLHLSNTGNTCYLRMYMYTYIHVCSLHIPNTVNTWYVHMYMYICTHVCSLHLSTTGNIWYLCVYMYTRIHVCSLHLSNTGNIWYLCVYMYTHTHVCSCTWSQLQSTHQFSVAIHIVLSQRLTVACVLPILLG